MRLQDSSRFYRILRRWLVNGSGMRSKHGAALALDILAANGITEFAIVQPDGRELRLLTKDKVIAPAVIRFGTFAAEAMATFRSLLEIHKVTTSEIVFVNVGANVGTTCLNAHAIGFRRFVAVEPEPENFRLLRHNLAGLSGSTVRLVQAAIGERAGRGALHRHKNNMGGHSLVAPQSSDRASDTIAVEIQPLTFCVEADEPFVLFVDVEGFEPQVLMSGADAIERNCRALVVELTPAKYSNDDTSRLCQQLAAFSDELFLLPSGDRYPASDLPVLLHAHRDDHFDIAMIRRK